MGKFYLVLVVIFLVLGALFSTQLLETNQAGYVQVKQAAGTGNMTVRTQPGTYPQMFADIHTYKVSDVYDFNNEPINVTFGDSSTANISGQIKYILPIDDKSILRIHNEFRSDEAVQTQMIRQVVASVLKQTSSMFSSEDVYSIKRSDFVALCNEQIKSGIYATTYSETMRRDEDGNTSLARVTAVKRNEQGVPYISEPSAFKRYGIEVVQLVINNIDFDDTTKALIVKRKEAEQERVVAKSKAERAKQDAITAEAQGKADVAKAEAEALVIKKTAVIAAEKNKEVAEQQALEAEQQKKAIIAKGQADAEANRLKVVAGLTPQERAEFEMKTAIGVAAEIAKVRLPQIFVGGGGADGQASPDPMQAVGLKSLIDISRDMAQTKTREQ